MQVDITADEAEQIMYCFGIARGLLWRDITREPDEEIKDLLRKHLVNLDNTIRSVGEKLSSNEN